MRKHFHLLALLCPVLAFGDWTVVGSDLLAPAIEPTIKAYAAHNNETITTDFIGSVPARAKLKAGEADIAVLAAPTDADLPGGEFKAMPIAYEVSIVVVDKLNPLTEISMNQLAAIYGSSSTANYTRWGDMGLQGPIAQRSIQPLALDNDATVSLELFKFKVLKSGSLKPNVTRVSDNMRLMDLVSSDTGSLAVTNKLILPEKIRALAISGEDQFAFGPTPENIHYGEYPLRLSYFIVYPRAEQEKLKPLLRSMLSQEQAEAFEREAFVPLPENVRKRMLVELDKAGN